MSGFSTAESSLRVSSLMVSPLPEHCGALETIFAGSPWQWDGVRTMEEARSWIARRGLVPILICDRDLPDGNWRQLFQQTQSLPQPPRFIVSSRLADEELWVEVLSAGGHDVLRTPFDAQEAFRIVRSASESWSLEWGVAAARQRPGNWFSKAVGSALSFRSGV